MLGRVRLKSYRIATAYADAAAAPMRGRDPGAAQPPTDDQHLAFGQSVLIK